MCVCIYSIYRKLTHTYICMYIYIDIIYIYIYKPFLSLPGNWEATGEATAMDADAEGQGHLVKGFFIE